MSDSNTKGIQQLFRDAERTAEEAEAMPRREPTIGDERLLEHIRGDRPLDARQRRQVVCSVDLRERMAILEHSERIRADDRVAERRASVREVWAQRGWSGKRMRLLAAADTAREVRPLPLEVNLGSVDMIPIDAEGRVWRINVQIARNKVETVLAETPGDIRLVDSEGLVWVEGRPNQKGELVGFWERDEDLLERVARVSFELEPW